MRREGRGYAPGADEDEHPGHCRLAHG
jgi:hypothetical protein